MRNDSVARTPLPEAFGRLAAASVAPVKRIGRSRRAILLTWLRKTHLYIGLWGAVLGLLFGATGLLMNHRAILKLPVEKMARKTTQIALPAAVPGSPEALSDYLQKQLQMRPAQEPITKAHKPQTVIWGGQEVMEPERWTVMLQNPTQVISAEYYVGNRFAKVEQMDATPIGTLMRLHTSSGVNAFWVVLSDTIAGSMILLSITGLLLWTQLHTIRTIAMLTSVGALFAASWFMWSL